MIKSSRLFAFLFTGVALVSIFGASHFYRQYEERNTAAMLRHCANINDDMSRPAERECVYPIDIDDKKFIFANREGKIERYEIVSTKANVYDDNDNTFYYNFIGFGEE